MSNDPELDPGNLENVLEDSLSKGAKIKGFERDDVAFGLVALPPIVIVPSDAGDTEAIEETFIEVEGVENVSAENVDRI